MNSLIYNFSSIEQEGTPGIQRLNAQVFIDREPIDDIKKECCTIDIWVDYKEANGEWSGKPEFDSFDESTAIALRDFLIFCFPLK